MTVRKKASLLHKICPLNAPKSHISKEALKGDLIPPLRKFRSPLDVDMNKYYQYHQKNGHNTGECTTLRDKVKELLRVGHLRVGHLSPNRVEYRRKDEKREKRQPDYQEGQRE